MNPYRIHVTLVDEDQGYRFSEWSEPVESYDLNDDGTPDFGAIYRSARAEYGRCVSSVYVDQADGPPKRVGWYFVKRDRYDRSDDTYLQGAWVTVSVVVAEATPELHEHVSVAS